MEDYGSSVIAQRSLHERLDEMENFHMGQVSKDGKSQEGPIIMLKKIVKGAYGLARLGCPDDVVSSICWCIQRWHDAVNHQNEEMIELMEEHAVFLLSKIWSLSILPEDISRDLALMPYMAKPGYDREPQKLVE